MVSPITTVQKVPDTAVLCFEGPWACRDVQALLGRLFNSATTAKCYPEFDFSNFYVNRAFVLLATGSTYPKLTAFAVNTLLGIEIVLSMTNPTSTTCQDCRDPNAHAPKTRPRSRRNARARPDSAQNASAIELVLTGVAATDTSALKPSAQ